MCRLLGIATGGKHERHFRIRGKVDADGRYLGVDLAAGCFGVLSVMAGMKKKRVPRPLVNPLAILADRSTEKLADDPRDTLLTVFLGSLTAMTDPEYADEKAWSNLVCALNTSLLLCKAGFNREMQITVDAALTAMVIVRQRALNGHGWHLANHYETVRAGFAVCQRHMKELPKEIQRKALLEVFSRTGNLQARAA